MFPKDVRLHLRLERDFFRRSKRGSFPVGIIFYIPSDKNLFAITISKNFSLSAVARNSLKRFLKEKILLFSSNIPKEASYKMVFLIKRNSKQSKEEIWGDIYEVLTKVYKN